MKITTLPYRYEDIETNERISYEDAKKLCFPKIDKMPIPKTHIGQLKLFFSELHFLTKCSKMKDGTILYVGAACGYHVNYLAKMFPKMMFELWDPSKFEVDETKNVKIYNRFFNDGTAKMYKNRKNLLFVCDMRNLDIATTLKNNLIDKNTKNDVTDKIIMKDMVDQARWAKIMQPKFSHLKFRIPYANDIQDKKYYIKYLPGKLYLQNYYSYGLEMRLLTNEYNKYVDYECKEIDEHNASFILCTKNFIKSIYWKDIMKKNNILNIFDNALALSICEYYLRKKYRRNVKDQEVVDLFLDVINFHVNKYGNKIRSVVFEKK